MNALTQPVVESAPPGTSQHAQPIRAPRGTALSCKGWRQEAALRMLMNNLDPDVAERPDVLIVYGVTGKAARSWPDFEKIVRGLQALENHETLLVQSGRAYGSGRRTGTHRAGPFALRIKRSTGRLTCVPRRRVGL